MEDSAVEDYTSIAMNVKTILSEISRKLHRLLLLGILAAAIHASGQGVDDALNQFKGKVLLLRHPLQSNSQQYASDGKVLSSAPEGAWTLYSGVLIDKLKLRPDLLQI